MYVLIFSFLLQLCKSELSFCFLNCRNVQLLIDVLRKYFAYYFFIFFIFYLFIFFF